MVLATGRCVLIGQDEQIRPCSWHQPQRSYLILPHGAPFELLVGLRYTRAKRRNHFISFISLSSMIGIALGVTVLITVLSVMNGFGEELRARILGVVSHITSARTRAACELGRSREDAARCAGYVASAPYVQGQGMITRGAPQAA